MSKVVLFLTLPALAGLVAWNVSLSSEVSDLRARLEQAPGKSAGQAPAGGGRGSEPVSEPRVRETARANPQMTELAARIAEVEKRLPPAPAAPGAAGTDTAASGAAPAAPTVPSDVVTYFASDAFQSAVRKVLEDRDAERERERNQRIADARARFLLRDLSVTDAQRTEVARILLASIQKIEQIRENEAIPDEQRRQEVQAAQQEQIESLAAVLDAQSMEQVRQRASGGGGLRRGMPPGDGGGRGGRRVQPGGGDRNQ